MRTTVKIDDRLLVEAKTRAADVQGRTLNEIVEDALREAFAQHVQLGPAGTSELLPVFRSARLLPGRGPGRRRGPARPDGRPRPVILLDVNVLVHAFHEASPEHARVIAHGSRPPSKGTSRSGCRSSCSAASCAWRPIPASSIHRRRLGRRSPSRTRSARSPTRWSSHPARVIGTSSSASAWRPEPRATWSPMPTLRRSRSGPDANGSRATGTSAGFQGLRWRHPITGA